MLCFSPSLVFISQNENEIHIYSKDNIQSLQTFVLTVSWGLVGCYLTEFQKQHELIITFEHLCLYIQNFIGLK